MHTYKVPISRDDYGYVIIQAKSKKHAIQLIEEGEWSDEMYTVKGGTGAEIYKSEVEKIN